MKIVDTTLALPAARAARRLRVERIRSANAIDGERPGKDVLPSKHGGVDGRSAPYHFGTCGVHTVPEPQFQAAFVTQVLGQMLDNSGDRRMRAQYAYAAQSGTAGSPIFVRAV